MTNAGNAGSPISAGCAVASVKAVLLGGALMVLTSMQAVGPKNRFRAQRPASVPSRRGTSRKLVAGTNPVTFAKAHRPTRCSSATFTFISSPRTRAPNTRLNWPARATTRATPAIIAQAQGRCARHGLRTQGRRPRRGAFRRRHDRGALGLHQLRRQARAGSGRLRQLRQRPAAGRGQGVPSDRRCGSRHLRRPGGQDRSACSQQDGGVSGLHHRQRQIRQARQLLAARGHMECQSGVHPLKISSVGDWCARANVFNEDHAHGVRPLVQDAKLLSAVE